MKKYIFIAIVLLIPRFVAQAATTPSLSWSFDQAILDAKGQAVVSLMISPSDEGINAISADININQGTARFNQIQDGNSIISAWIEKPTISNNIIHFAGIIPGGFAGVYSPFNKDKQPGLVLQFVLSTKTPGTVSLGISNVQAFSGQAQALNLSIDPQNLNINFTKVSDEHFSLSKSDTTTPSDLGLQITHLDKDTKNWFAVFSARDNESGIDHYEYQESFESTPDPSKWQTAESPKELIDQSLHHYVFVKAVDRNGNEKIISVQPNPSSNSTWLYVGIFLAVIILLGVLTIVRQRRL